MRYVGFFLLGGALGASLALLPFAVVCLIFIAAFVVAVPIAMAVMFIVDAIDDARYRRTVREHDRADRRAAVLARIKSEVGSR